MRFPTIPQVRAAVVEATRNLRAYGCAMDDVRLQVHEDGAWALRRGDASYDQDHRGYWGCSRITIRRQNAERIARDLLRQCREHAAS